LVKKLNLNQNFHEKITKLKNLKILQIDNIIIKYKFSEYSNVRKENKRELSYIPSLKMIYLKPVIKRNEYDSGYFNII